jgi:hypothetical protein
MDLSRFNPTPSTNVQDDRDKSWLGTAADIVTSTVQGTTDSMVRGLKHPFSPMSDFDQEGNPIAPKTADPLSTQAGYNAIGRNFTGRYNTPLSAPDEAAFQKWTNRESQALGRNVSADNYDYDMRGWWQQHGGAPLAEGHLTDQFKKPNHPTFSDESQYHGADGNQGGHWDKQPDDTYAFTPGATNMYSTPELQDYFKQVEPGNALNLPPT